MKRDLMEQALGFIRPTFIAQAAQKKRKPLGWISAVAALAALVLLLHSTGLPLISQVKAVSTADYPKYERLYRGNEMEPMEAQLQDFFQRSMTQTLGRTEEENLTYSPVNLYMALSLGAELTAGNTRQQILDVLGAADADTLRQQMHILWNACYYDDKDQTLLANSLWLDQDLDYRQDTMELLAENYYTSVYQGQFGKESTDKAIINWLNRQTGDLLEEATQSIHLDPDTVLAAYSTVYYRAMWIHGTEFSGQNNTQQTFHAPQGDVTATFMHKKEMQTHYYAGTDFGALSLGLRDGSKMWFVLPDADKTVHDVLDAGEYAAYLFGQHLCQDPDCPDIGIPHSCHSDTCDKHRYLKVNLSVPKFDIQASGDLKADLIEMGITDIFTPYTADFSASVESDLPVFLSAVNQATRVAIDEEGVTAASYIEMPAPGAAMPPEEIIDFVLDRPFLFFITNRYDVPLFCGVVNTP